MLLLDSNICTDVSFLATVLFIKKLVKIISIIIPILLVLLLTIDFAKAVMASDDNQIKTTQKKAIKRIIYALIIFFVPIVVDASFSILGEKEVSGFSCYYSANDETVELLAKAEKEKDEKYIAELEKLIEKGKINQALAKEKINELRKKASQGGSSPGIVATNYTLSNGKISQATSSENGSMYGKPGDQTKREVSISSKMGTGWAYVARFKDPNKAELAARCMENAANNNHIGYDGNRRTSLYNEAKKYNFDVSKVTKNVDTTCSNLVSVCINYTGVEFPSEAACRTGQLKKQLTKRSDFSVFSFSKKTTIYRGDILFHSTHTAIAL